MKIKFLLMRAIVLLLILNVIHLNVFSQDKKVALLSFFCDKKIQGTGLGDVAIGLVKDTNFNLKPMLEKAYNRFTIDFAKDFPFQFLDKATILGNAEFQNFHSKTLIDTGSTASSAFNADYVTIDGLKRAIGAEENLILVKEDRRDPCVFLKMFGNSADGVMLVKLSYEFDSRLMGAAAGIRAYIYIALYNKNCDLVFRTKETATSKGKVLRVGGIPVMKPEKIQPLCEDATEELFNDLKGKLPKMLKKIDAKF
jgi:hypothetical protein